MSATQVTNGAQRQLEQRRQSARTLAEQQEIDRSHVEALGELRVRLRTIGFPSGMDGDLGRFKAAIGQEQSAFIHAAGSSTPDGPTQLAQIDRSVQSTQTASNRIRHDLGLPSTNQCL
ncbi:MAG: hypothetical protein J2P57_24230 [Acidimicrobiaceae bacterium]|nr:hypothetical protein [Acidimicrobiaceae bacterium]